MKRILFMGTPEFACGILKCLIENHYNVVGVVSQPDKKVGRKQVLTPTPVKSLAASYNLSVFQPVHIKDIYEQLRQLDLDCIITCAYGQMIPEDILHLAKIRCINVHASLLPKYRGGAPIHKAIINGEKESGVSIMEMVKKMDAGDVCCVKKVAITEEDTMGSLHDKLMKCGEEALLEVLDDILDNKAVFVPQDESQVSFAWNITKEEEKIDFSKGGRSVYDHIRGLIPSPVGYAYLENKKIKFHEVRLLHEESVAAFGEIIGFDGTHLQVSLGDLILLVTQLQPEGKAKMSARDFYNGHGKNLIGKRFE